MTVELAVWAGGLPECGGVEVEYVDPDRGREPRPLTVCWPSRFGRVSLVRGFASFRDQRSWPGWLWFAAAGIIALFPVTPGGLGLVEASLSGLLILAGVRTSYAVLATLAYRIASCWLPLLAGPPTYLLFRHRYGPVPRRATPSEADSTA